jgi:hypothetical protein
MKKIILVLLCVIMGACTFQTKHRGYVFPNDLEEKIATVKTTTQLEDLIGSPQVKTVHGETVWIYFGEDENYHGPFPLTYDNKTVLLVWVNGNRVVKTRVLHDEDLPDIKMDDDETEIPAAIELNAMEELFNNIGRFSPAGLGQ